MGYMHIDNLYKNRRVMQFKEVYALEKVHGTSAHIKIQPVVHVDTETLGNPVVARATHMLTFYSGGAKYEEFVKCFDVDNLTAKVLANGNLQDEIIVYGEAYGGKMQGMRNTYGNELRFIVFDVCIAGLWLDVERAYHFANKLGLEFVPYEKGPSTPEWLNEQRDRPSRVAMARGMGNDRKAEGIVIRPPFEVIMNNGSRCMAKHKRDDYQETKTARSLNPAEQQFLIEAESIADEWVTDMRLMHVLDKIHEPHDFTTIPTVLDAMVEDVLREASTEIVDSSPARKAIRQHTLTRYKKYLANKLSTGS